LHCVPVDMGWATDQVPEAQRWKAVPEIQFHWPSVLQLPVRAPETEPESDPDSEPEDEEVVAGAGAGAVEDTGTGSGALDGVDSGTGATDTETAAEALSAGAEEEPDELEPESEPELEEPAETVMPEPPKVGVPVQASEPSAARLPGWPLYSTLSPA
jgi:hypothetical protein